MEETALKKEHILSVFSDTLTKLTTPEIRKAIRRQENYPKFTKRALNQMLHKLKNDGILLRDKEQRWSVS